MNDLIPIQRRERIIELLKKKGICTIDELVKEFGTSEITIHRDLDQLELEGQVLKVHRGVKLAETEPIFGPFAERVRRHRKEKEAIARKALEYVHDGDALFIDSSSTGLIFAKTLSASGFHNLKIVTNSPVITYEVVNSSGIDLISTGGVLENEYRALIGPWTLEFISRLHFDSIFISCGGITLEKGLTTDRIFVAEVLQTAAKVTNRVIVLVDSSKFIKNAMIKIFFVDKVDLMITDGGVATNVAEEFIKGGVRLVKT